MGIFTDKNEGYPEGQNIDPPNIIELECGASIKDRSEKNREKREYEEEDEEKERWESEIVRVSALWDTLL